jgi:hypothetical protein
MTLKAAYFRLIGFSDSQPITGAHLETAFSTGVGLGILWPKKGRWHNLRAWAELIVFTRALTL